MATILLSDRNLVRVGGPDAEHLLQNIVTADLDALKPGEAKPSALLTPQGKILFDFLISRDGADAFLLDCRKDIAEDLVLRLMLYRLRAKAEISLQDELLVAASWGDDLGGSQSDLTRLRDLRFAELPVWRLHGAAFEGETEPSEWNRLRIANGIAESGSDYELSDAFPHDVLLDLNGGVGFKKGCYVGQEVVSRMQHRGTARRRVMIVSADAALPGSGSAITANDRAIGALGTVEGRDALAIVRIDRVRDALESELPILAGDVPLQFTFPPGATFTFETAPGEDAS